MLRSLIACSLLCATPLAAEKQDVYEMVHEFVAELKKVVPEGWDVTVNQLHADSWRRVYDRGEVNVEVWRKERAQFHVQIEINPFDPVPARPGGERAGEPNPFLPPLADEDDELKNEEANEADDDAEEPNAHVPAGGFEEALGNLRGIPSEELMRGMSDKEREKYKDELKGREHPYFNFHLLDYITPEEYARRVAKNKAIDKRHKELTDTMLDIKHHGKDRAFGSLRSYSFHPETDEERKRVQELADFEKANPKQWIRHGAYYKTLSFVFHDNRSNSGLKSKEVDAECDAVLKKIQPLFRYYEVEKKPEK